MDSEQIWESPGHRQLTQRAVKPRPSGRGYKARWVTGTEPADGKHRNPRAENKKSRRAESRPAGLTDFFSGGEGGIRIFYISI